MIISASRSQHHKNGVRISKALFAEIMLHAKARKVVERQNSKCKNGREVFYIGGIVANVYAFENHAGKANWAEVLLGAGEINDINDYMAPVAA